MTPGDNPTPNPLSPSPYTSPSRPGVPTPDAMPTASEMFEVKTGAYRPPYSHHMPFGWLSLPPFTIQAVEMMRRDSQVRLGMAIKTAPLLKPKFEITGDPQIVEFVAKTIRRFWIHAVPQVLKGMWYRASYFEQKWKHDDEAGGAPMFDFLRGLYPQDCRILTRGGEKFGIKVRMHGHNADGGRDEVVNAVPSGNERTDGGERELSPMGDIRLIGPKSFLYVHKREFGSWDGFSELEGCFDPWLEKADLNGARAIRKLWFYKNVFDGGVLFHPPGSYTDPANPNHKIPYRDLARWALESAKVGGVWAFDNVLDEKGQPLWKYERPQIQGGGDMLLQYPKDLDIEILHGLEVPDDIVSMVNPAPGGHGGRTIPLSAFLISQNVTLQEITTEVVKQVLAPLVKVRFDSNKFEIQTAEINIDALMPEGTGQGPDGRGGAVEQGQEGGEQAASGSSKNGTGNGHSPSPASRQRQLSQGLFSRSAAVLLNMEPALVSVNGEPIAARVVI